MQVLLADGSIFEKQGRITFADADFDQDTGTFRLRATFPNPDGSLRQGQFVRVRVIGAVRPNAILVPQKAVLQGAQGHFVMVVDKDNKAQIRPGSGRDVEWRRLVHKRRSRCRRCCHRRRYCVAVSGFPRYRYATCRCGGCAPGNEVVGGARFNADAFFY